MFFFGNAIGTPEFNNLLFVLVIQSAYHRPVSQLKHDVYYLRYNMVKIEYNFMFQHVYE